MANNCTRCGWHYMKHGSKNQCPGQRGKQGKKDRFTPKKVLTDQSDPAIGPA